MPAIGAIVKAGAKSLAKEKENEDFNCWNHDKHGWNEDGWHDKQYDIYG